MKILIVCSGNTGKLSPYVAEQIESLEKLGINYDYYLINGKGAFEYLRNLPKLIKKINQYKPNIIHAHYGFSGLLACLQRKVPVITTLHGSDVNNYQNRVFSKLTTLLSAKTIVVSNKLAKIMKIKNPIIIPCGVNLQLFQPKDKFKCRIHLGLNLNTRYILFSSAFNKKIKNYQLAKTTVEVLNEKGYNIKLIELKDYTRGQVSQLINAVDCCLMTSFTEGSPQFIKEAMACNCPIVSTDVGDVKENIGCIKNCYVTSFNPKNLIEKLKLALDFSKNKGKTRARIRIIEKRFDSETIARRIFNVYKDLFKNKKSLV